MLYQNGPYLSQKNVFLPTAGNIPYLRSLNKPLHEVYVVLQKKYGDVVRLRLGPSMNLVIIMGLDNIQEAAVNMNDKFKFRPTNLFATKALFKNKGTHLSHYVSCLN